MAGLFAPAFFVPVILVQIVYKTVWLAVFVLPLVLGGKPFPAGISWIFLAIVIVYPVLLWLSTRGGAGGPGTPGA